MTEWRRGYKEKLFEKIEASMGKQQIIIPNLYQPNKKSEDLTRRYIIKPLLEDSSKWTTHRRYEDKKVIGQVMKDIIPKGSKAVPKQLRIIQGG